MKTLIRNVEIIPLGAEGKPQKKGNICIDGRLITAVGDVPPDFEPAETVEGSGMLAVPGFFNAHCHSPMTFERGWAEDLPLDRWFNERIWVAESALTAEDVYWGAALGACEMIRSGCVGFNDHYFHMDRVGEVVETSGMKAALTWCRFGIGDDKEIGGSLETALRFTDTWNGKADGRIRTVIGPHSPYVCPEPFLKEMAGIARSRNLPIHIHASESREQVKNSVKTHGKTPIAFLEACGLFEVPAVVAHALYLGKNDVSILSGKGVSVAYCPITYMKLAMGTGDLRPLLDAGVNVCLGTDGPGSNSDMDMKEVIRFTPLLQKFSSDDAEALPGDIPLRMATGNGARAMGFPDSGSLERGKAADIVLFRRDRPHWFPNHDPVANLVHCGKGADVEYVFIDGRMVLKRGELLTLDEGKIRFEADARARKMVGRNLSIVREYRG